MVGDALLDADELGIVGHLGLAHHIAQDLPQLGVAGGDDHVAVLGREHVVGIGRLIAVADPLGDAAGGLVDHGDVLHGGGHRVHQGHVHLFAQAGLLLVHQGRQHADGQVQAAQHVAHGGAAAGGGTAGPAGGAHQAAHGLAHDVVAGALAEGAGVAEAGAGAVDDAGVDLLQHVIAQAQLLHGAGAVVLDDHIGLLHHLLEDLLGLGVLQVQGDTHLAAVEVRIVNALIVDKGAHAPAVIALAGLLDLDDRGAHIRHQRTAIGAGQHTGQVQNNDAFQQSFFLLHDKNLPFHHHYYAFGMDPPLRGRDRRGS